MPASGPQEAFEIGFDKLSLIINRIQNYTTRRLRLVTGLLLTLDEADIPACNLHSFSRRKLGPEAVFPDLSVKL